mgnify:FL=1
MSNLRDLLPTTAERVIRYREALAEHRVQPEADVERFRETFGGALPAAGQEASA